MHHGTTSLALTVLALGSSEVMADSPKEIDEAHLVESVVVTGSRTQHSLDDSPVATEVIARAEIEGTGARDAAELLEQHPGVAITRSFRGAGIQMQGLDSKYVLILVDGERAIGRIGGSIDLSRFSTKDIERIELVRGPSSSLYGSDAIGGVVNIITRQSERSHEAEIHSTVGGRNALDISAHGGLRSKNWNTRLSAGWRRADGFDLDPSDVATTGSEVNAFNFQNRTSYQLSKAIEIRGQASYLRTERSGVDESAAGAVLDRNNLTETLSASLGAETRMSGYSTLRTNAHYSQFQDQFLQDQRDSMELDQYQKTSQQLAKGTVQYERLIHDRHLVSIGSESSHERLRSKRLDGGGGARSQIALFAQDEWTILEEPLLVVVPGARLDVDTQFGTNSTPKLSVRFDPVESIVVRASYGLGFRAPSFKERLLRFENPSAGYVIEGNESLAPESSKSINVGAEYRPTKSMRVSANVFRNDIDNLIATQTIQDAAANTSRQIGYVNVASASTQGLETTANIKATRWLTLELGYTLTDTHDDQAGRPLEGQALHRASLGVRMQKKRWGLEVSINASIAGPRPYYENAPDGMSERVDSDPSSVVDGRIAKHLGTDLTLFAGTENLLNAGDVQRLQIPPRTFYGGLIARY